MNAPATVAASRPWLRALATFAAVSVAYGLLAASPQSIPNDDSSIASATIRRDSFGVPHILAQSEAAAAFAHGYATAEDHFQEVTRLFLRARGEQAAVFGESFVGEDTNIQLFRIWEIADKQFAQLPPHMQGILNGYAAGYNLYLVRHRGEAPEWARPVTGVDVLAHCRAVLLLDFALNLQPWRQLASTDKGSNMWMVGRPKSASGRALLLANPHLNWRGSQIFHEVHITVPGTINVAGASLIGFPVIVIGFNEHLGWSHTVNFVDSDDVYELTRPDRTTEQYLYDGRVRPLTSVNIAVRVKTSTGIQVRTRRVMSSHYGPVINLTDTKAYAFKSANLELVNFLTQYNQMAKASDFGTFRAALNMQQLPMFNVGYADRAGNIFYLFNGRIPIRPKGFTWSGIVPGGRSDTEWFALHPLSELPQTLNPATGYLQNGNDAPWYANLAEAIPKSAFPDYFAPDALGARGQIGLQRLSSAGKLTLEDVKAAKYDARQMTADRVKADLVALAGQSGGDPALAEAAALLKAWDNQVTRTSRGSVLFARWWELYTMSAKPVYRQPWAAAALLTTPSGLGDANAALTALQTAITSVRQDYGSLSVAWGDVYRLRRGNVDEPISGAPEVFRTIRYQRGTDGKYLAVGGDSYVLAVEFSDSPTAFSVMAYSQSADPMSKHYADQSTIFAREGYKRLWFTDRDIEANLEHAYQPGAMAEANAAPAAR
jgi:acyl-homoserine-lactone acylase